ncbi:MAG: N-acetylmuramoyl-L-alanine amidase [Ignavibacteriae bacterium]|nr:N-acetylmuramoyl-L-alanine amidase [Ignavibacteriota bacterium]
MKQLFAVVLALALSSPGSAQIPAIKDTIILVVPESDTVTTTTSTYRLSASTNPLNKVTVNGKPYNVYPSGAFCGKLDVNIGENIFAINSISQTGSVRSKTFVIKRPKPIETTRADTLAIEDMMMQPYEDLWLNEGDMLQVQIKGTPGCIATFMNDQPMKERPSTQTRLGGIYRGTYKVKATDTLLSQPITFRLTDSTGRSVERSTYAKVSFKSHQLPMVGVIKGERPFLNTGLGQDRLGGHKFSIINPGIRVTVTGKVGDMYRVALTDNQEVWIDEDFIELQPTGTFFPSSLTGSIFVEPEGNLDVVTLSMFDKLPYSTYQELEPSRIVVDVYGATSNTNWITQQLTTKEIKDVYYQQVEKGVFRITIELRHKQIWGYEIVYEGTNLKIKVKRQPEKLKLSALTFALDAGHGGDNRGAVGSTGSLEKNVNAAITAYLKQLLEEEGARVILTRPNDANPRMVDRYLTAYRGGADVLLSVHSNSIGLTGDPAETKGAGTFYKHIAYRRLTQFVLDEILKTGLDTLGNVGSFNFSLNAPTEFPNMLIETAFMSNPEDEMKLLDDGFRKELAERIVDGIEEFLDYCDEE